MTFSQNLEPSTPDVGVLQFVEAILMASGHLDGLSTLAWLMRLGQPTPQQRAGMRLALAMYGERVDPSAHTLLREAISGG